MPRPELQTRDLLNLLLTGSFDFHGRNLINVNLSNDTEVNFYVGETLVAKINASSNSTSTGLWILHNGSLKNVKTFNDGTHDVLYV